VLDEAAFEEHLDAAPDEALALLADLTGATDAALRDLARRLAARVVIDIAATRGTTGRGRTARLRTRPMPEVGGDLDLDASLDTLVAARLADVPPEVDELRAQVWSHPGRAVCLLVDRSGSMRGEALATAALAAAAVAFGAPDDHSVVAFGADAVVVKSQDVPKAPGVVVEELLALRGHGTTDLCLAFTAGRAQLERSTAPERLVVLLSDCRATTGDDHLRAAADLASSSRLVVVAPEADADTARTFAAAVGAAVTTVAGPAEIPAAFAALLA
jgi:Mg-chelatase subunit ChlD